MNLQFFHFTADFRTTSSCKLYVPQSAPATIKDKNIFYDSGFEKSVFPLGVGRLTVLTLVLSLVVVQGQD